MARLSSSKNSWSTALSVFFMLFFTIASVSMFGASQESDADSSDAKSDAGLAERESAPGLLEAESINDLYRKFSNDLSRLRAAYDLIGDADEAKLIDLFDHVTQRKYTQEEEASKSELISLISSRLAVVNLDKTISLFESQPPEVAKHILYGLMHAWAGKDFDVAAKYARKLDASIHSVALRGIVDASPSVSESVLMQLGAELGDVAYVERVVAARQLETDLADPDQAWANLINDPKINLEENFYRVQLVANALIGEHGAAEIDDLL
ncbi:MAG: hypothetical protein F4Z87_05805, partial [Gammaproteobacteria bacterium]|nr:hypothetical protein [Gammaproteobacteria bacterium]